MASTSRDSGRTSDRDRNQDRDRDQDSDYDDREERDEDRSGGSRSNDEGSSSRRRRRLPAVQIVRQGVAQLREITGRDADTVSGIEPTDDGCWILQVELVELERIPASTSVLASYEAELDAEGNLLEYRRVRRYFRNQADGRE